MEPQSVQNPFTYAKPLHPAELIDRENEAKKLLELATGGHNTRLSAPRRYGKTSLLLKVLDDAEAVGFQSVYVNFFGVLTVEDVVMRIEEAYRSNLKGQLQNWLVGKLSIWRPIIRADVPGARVGLELSRDELRSETARRLYSLLDLPKKIYKKTGKRTVIVFDEFQDVLKVDENADGLIRSRIELHRDEASYIFAGSHPGMMAKLFGDRERPLYGQARAINLLPLNNEDLAECIAERFELSNRDIGELLEPLLFTVRGHPQRAMQLSHHIWDATDKGRTADQDCWFSALDAIYAEIKDGFALTWDGLQANDRKVLAAIAERYEHLFGEKTLTRFNLSSSTVERTRTRLLAEGYIQIDDSGPLVIDPFFELWIANDRRGLSKIESI